MVRLENIEYKEEYITCTAYVEDCKDPIKIIFCTADGEMQNTPLPSGYEWCEMHLFHAKMALAEISQKKLNETRKTVMWY